MKNNTVLGLLVIIIIALIIYIFIYCNPTDGKESPISTTAPEQAISLEQARELQQEFVRTRAGILNDSLKITDTRDFWFSLETMEHYIAYVKNEGAKMEYTDMGIRIYFAAYPKDSKDPKADPGYATVILVPTTGKFDRNVKGFFPMAPVQSTAGGIQSLNYGQGGKPPKDI